MAHDPTDDDVRAGEYVLGLLESAEARAFEMEAASRPSLAAAIIGWERRLQPLLQDIPAVSAPHGLWSRIEASAFGMVIRKNDLADPHKSSKTSLWRSLPMWRTATAGFALAAAFAGVALLHRSEPPSLVAALLPPGQPGPVIVAQALSGGRIAIQPLGKITVADRRDLELWALAKGAIKPVSLGIMPSNGVVLDAGKLPSEGQIMISIEPRSGSPTGLPTGSVVWAGTIGADSHGKPFYN